MVSLPDLPISPYIPQIAKTLKDSPSRFLILTAETGAGKSTVIPAGLSEFFDGKILITEPRRIAALSIAERVSEILGEQCGKKCGYKIHLENKISSETKIEIVTEAILSRTLQNDPSLEGYSVIVLDEFHERSVTTDLNLAFLREAMELRDDLFVIIMSATMDTNHLREYLCGGDNDSDEKVSVPVMEIPGRTFPVEVEYKPNTEMVSAIWEELVPSETPKRVRGDNCFDFGAGSIPNRAQNLGAGKVILAFLPGIKEIRQTENELQDLLKSKNVDNTEIILLHSSVSFSEQKKIFLPLKENSNRVIISSAIAETSLTVPGVTAVIDSGLSRVNRLNIALGMETLVTEDESEFSAEQRKGRAGRTQEGRCIRLWNKNEQRQKSMLPEILRSDISSLVLECAAWGKILSEEKNTSNKFFLDSPSTASINSSTEFLQNMKFLDDEKKITARGRLALECGTSPRLANIILYAAENAGENTSIENDAVNLILKYSNYAESKIEMQKKFCDDIRKKIQRVRKNGFKQGSRNLEGENNLPRCPRNLGRAALLFSGFSDRLAKKQAESNHDLSKQNLTVTYQFPNGHTATLAGEITFSQAPEWIIAPEVLATNSCGTIFNYDPLTDDDANALISNLVHEETECFFNEDNTKISKFVYTKYGKITLSKKRICVTKDDSVLAWCQQIHQKGLNSLDLSYKTHDFLTRAQFFCEHGGSLDFARDDINTTRDDNNFNRDDNNFNRDDNNFNRDDSKAALDDSNAGRDDGAICHVEPGRDILLTETLETEVEKWLPPFLTDGNLTDEIVYNAIYWYLDGSEIDKNVPTQIILPNGRKAKVVYEMNSSPDDKTKLIIRPVIEIIIQRIFGCFENPKIMGVPVLLKLLSPANRPLQITDDLAGFWNGTWVEICKEMKGRYPKHNWDYRVAEKE